MATMLRRAAPNLGLISCISTSHGVQYISTVTHTAAKLKFDWEDPLNSKDLFTDEEIEISRTARDYCRERLLPRVLSEFCVT